MRICETEQTFPTLYFRKVGSLLFTKYGEFVYTSPNAEKGALSCLQKMSARH